MIKQHRRAGVLLLLICAALLPPAAYAASAFIPELREWTQFVNLILIPGTWWCATVTARLSTLEREVEKIAKRPGT